MKPRLLLAEPERLLNWAISTYLADSFEITYAETPDEALSVLGLSEFEILIVGCPFPGVGCGDFAKRARQVSSHVQIVLMREHAERLSECINCSSPCDLALVKPVELAPLKAALLSLLPR